MSKKRAVCAIHNYPVVPEESPRHAGSQRPPVTRRDLGADFRNAMQFINCDWRTSPMYRHVFGETRLASVIWGQWYGNVEARAARGNPAMKGQSVEGWEEGATNLARLGIYIHALNSLARDEISRPHFERMRAIFGPRWLGFNEGEWDGAYISMVASGQIPLPQGRSRREACRHYLDWLGGTYEKHHHHMVTISSLGFGCHYAAELGTRMVGLELGQSLPSNTVLMSFCRGAGKQYDLLMAVTPSVFATRGAAGLKCYPKQGQPQSLCFPDGYVGGPDHGTTLGLMKRLWWLCYMNGASIVGIESAYFPCDVGGDETPQPKEKGARWEFGPQGSLPLQDPVNMQKIMAHFTPMGWLFWECKETAKRYPLRGVPYIPIAVMLPFDHGWYPQPNIYAARNTNCVWGNIPYEGGDSAIDRFFNCVYPGYALANWCRWTRDERGMVNNTPFGDSFDIILSNATEECLAKYQAVVLLGRWDSEAREEAQGRLDAFARAGGLVADWRGESGLADLGRILNRYTLIEIEGRPIYYLVNVTDRPDELIVTLCNNSAALPWEGRVRVKGQEIAEVEEWLAYGEADIHERGLRCGVPPNDVRTYRMRTRRPFLSLRFDKVPWRELGFGVPE